MEEENQTNFQKYRSKLKDLYSNDRTLYNRIGYSQPLSSLNKVKSKDAQDLFNEAISNPSSAPDLSLAAYYMADPYKNIIDYYKNLFYIRYTIVPKLIKEAKVGELEDSTNWYDINYKKVTSSVDGINLETVLPEIAEQALLKGQCGIVTEKNKISETIVTFFLPIGYFKIIGKTQFGSNIIAFDYKYFDNLKSSAQGSSTSAVENTDFEAILNSMPKLLQKGYAHYLENTTDNRWQVLDPKFSTSFNFNELCIPPKLGAFPASSDYNAYKDIQLEKSAQQLDKIFTHQIPTNSDGDLIMDIDEAIDVAQNMKATLKDIPAVKVVTTFGDSELHDLASNFSEQIGALADAYNNIYSSAGVDYKVFISDKDVSYSIKRDKAFMWSFYQKVMLFYNLTFNEILNYKPYQIQINLLPITVLLEKDEVADYVERAGVGLGRLQAVVAAGVKQSDLDDTYKVEEYLHLDKLLKPLQSMYQASGNSQTTETDSSESEDSEDKEEDTDEQEEEE